MPVYGLCPKTEVFELVVCNYCGLKYKLPAFAEHISKFMFLCILLYVHII